MSYRIIRRCIPLKYDARLTVWFTIGQKNFTFYPFWISLTVYIIIYYGTRDLWKSFWTRIIKIKNLPIEVTKENIIFINFRRDLCTVSPISERFVLFSYTKLLAAFFSQCLLEKLWKLISLRFSIKLWIKRRNWPKKNC